MADRSRMTGIAGRFRGLTQENRVRRRTWRIKLMLMPAFALLAFGRRVLATLASSSLDLARGARMYRGGAARDGSTARLRVARPRPRVTRHAARRAFRHAPLGNGRSPLGDRRSLRLRPIGPRREDAPARGA